MRAFSKSTVLHGVRLCGCERQSTPRRGENQYQLLNAIVEYCLSNCLVFILENTPVCKENAVLPCCQQIFLLLLLLLLLLPPPPPPPPPPFFIIFLSQFFVSILSLIKRDFIPLGLRKSISLSSSN